MRILLSLLLLASLMSAAQPARAKEACEGDCASCHQLSLKEAEGLIKKTGGTVISIKQAPIKGMFELLLEKDGRQGIIYIDYAKKNFMQGFIVNFDTLQKVSAHNLELPQPRQTSHADPRAVPVKNAIVMGNPKGSKKIYVFTDPDCPYCRELHQELKKLEKMAPDLAINIMLYPLPMHPEAVDKCRSLITHNDRKLLDQAFEGGALPGVGTLDGGLAVAENISYARRNEIFVAPSIMLADGRVIQGFKTAADLAALINVK
jgi:thiol:disulfide interchange protein DsbC